LFLLLFCKPLRFCGSLLLLLFCKSQPLLLFLGKPLLFCKSQPLKLAIAIFDVKPSAFNNFLELIQRQPPTVRDLK
jgi:hypothetical protein